MAFVSLGLLGLGCSPDVKSPQPVVSGVSPQLVCSEHTDPATLITVTGESFSPLPLDTLAGQVGVELPTITLYGESALPGGGSPSASVTVTEDVTWQSSREMAFELPAGVSAGVYGINVKNPGGEEDTLGNALVVVPPPEITGIEPPAICVEQADTTLTIVGANFLFTADAAPTVIIGGHEYTGQNPQECVDLPAPATGARLCGRFDIVVPQGDLEAPATYTVVVRNPAPAACEAEAEAILEITAPPTVTGVTPSLVCENGDTFVVSGSGFEEGATAQIDGADPVAGTVNGDGTELTVTFPAGTIASGTYDLTVINPSGCSATLPDAITVYKPMIFFVDPPILYNGIAVQITIYGSQLLRPVTHVYVQLHGTTDRIELTDVTAVPGHPNEIQALVPAGLAAGDYDVIVTDESTCEGVLENGLKIVDQVTIELTAIDPPFGWTDAPRGTAVTITADTGAGAPFVETPRVYISNGAGAATALRAVVYQGPASLTAVVPGEGLLAPDRYDVIVINPDGNVGVLTGLDTDPANDERFEVTAAEPPSITDVTPASFDSGTTGQTTAATITGSGFATPSVALLCVDPLGVPLADRSAAVTGGDATTINADIPIDLAAGTACILRVVNGDGTYGNFSAITYTNPASNLTAWHTSEEAQSPVQAMTTARRALALVSGRATAAARYLYAIAGDTGDASGALDSVECSPVDLVGRLAGWWQQRSHLTTPRTLISAARIGQFVYVAGGNDGTGADAALAGVERAQILDPFDVPQRPDLGLIPDPTGLDPGTWVYRVSGVRDAAYGSDPGGETLPSEPVNVTIPALDDGNKVQVRLSWPVMTDVVGYRVYRTPTAGEAAGAAQFLAEISGAANSTYTDTGAATDPARDPPLAIGSLGTWHDIGPQLKTARQGAVALAGLAGATGGVETWYLYVGGGRGATGAALGDYEYLEVTVNADGTQTVGAGFSVGTRSIGTPRWKLAGWAVDHGAASRVPAGATFIYFGGGETAAGADARDTVAGRVTSTGDLEVVFTSTPAGELDPVAQVSASGAGAVAVNNFLFQLGGGGSPSTSSNSGEICAASGGGCTSGPPALRNWNGLGGGAIAVPRYLPGAALQSAFIFLAGGQTDTDAATTSVERTIW